MARDQVGVLALPSKSGMGGKRLLHDGRSVDEYFHVSAGVGGKPAREVFEFGFDQLVIVVALRVDLDRCAITDFQDRERIIVWPVVQPQHDDRANFRPQGERRSAPVGARCQPGHVAMCAVGDKVFEAHFEFWRCIRLHDAERVEAALACLFGEGRFDRGRIV